jgi:hypothetical protein
VPAPGVSSDMALRVLEGVAKKVLPNDIGYSWSNTSYQEKESAGKGASVFIMALLFVFLILAAQYESWKLQSKHQFYETEKLDGSSSTFYINNGEFGVCSRNLELEDGDNIYYRIANKYNLKELMGNGSSIQGEICGPIQGNPLKLSEADLFVFNYKDLNTRSYTNRYNSLFLNLNLKDVPVVKIFSNDEIKCLTIQTLLELANSQKYGNDPAEGIVIRGFKNGETMYSQKLQKMLSVKIINQNYKD